MKYTPTFEACQETVSLQFGYTEVMKKYLRLVAVIMAFLAITIGAFFLAETITENETIRDFVQSLGILGVILVGLVGGLNAFVPIPPATFAPLFLEAGMSTFMIIGGFIIGTTIADSIGFMIGWLGSSYTSTHHPELTERLQSFMKKHERLIPYIIFGFFMLAPVPNETILIPLAIMGYRYKKLIVPLIIGNTVHQSLMVYGYSSMFAWLF